MSRTGRGAVEHDSASRIRNITNNMPENVSKAVEKLKELNEAENYKPEPAPTPEGLKELIMLGKIIDDVVIGPYTFKISTISSRQQKDILKSLFLLSNEDKISSLKIITLAEAIVSVNGVKLSALYTEGEDISESSKKVSILSELQSNVIDKLFEKFEELNKRSNDIFKSGGLEDSVKN